MHVLLEMVHGGFQSLSLGLLEREHHLPGAGAALRLLHLLPELVFLRFPRLYEFQQYRGGFTTNTNGGNHA